MPAIHTDATAAITAFLRSESTLAIEVFIACASVRMLATVVTDAALM
jgi:hypothetical protein